VPNYTLPKDTGMSFINTVQRKAKQTPPCNAYKTALNWTTKNGCFHKGSKRLTFTDEAAKHSKQVPAPSFYFGKDDKTRPHFISGGTVDKCKTDDFLTVIQRAAKKVPGPTSYDAKVSYPC
jgi:hypothetical protein